MIQQKLVVALFTNTCVIFLYFIYFIFIYFYDKTLSGTQVPAKYAIKQSTEGLMADQSPRAAHLGFDRPSCPIHFA